MSDLTQSIEDRERQLKAANMGFEFINCLAATGVVLWNNSGQLTEYPENIGGNAATSMSIDFLRNASDLMLERSFINPPYVLVAPTAVIVELTAEYFGIRGCGAPTEPEFESLKVQATETMRLLAKHIEFSSPEPISVNYIGNTIGRIGEVILVASNYFGVGAPGSLGVQRENVRGELMVTTSSYLFGSEWLKHGVYPSCLELRTKAAYSPSHEDNNKSPRYFEWPEDK